MTHRQAAFAAQTETMIKNLEKRGMEGYFFEDSASCTAAILSSIPEGSTISWGGSASVKECGLMDKIQQGNYDLIDYFDASEPEERKKLYATVVCSFSEILLSHFISPFS